MRSCFAKCTAWAAAAILLAVPLSAASSFLDQFLSPDPVVSDKGVAEFYRLDAAARQPAFNELLNVIQQALHDPSPQAARHARVAGMMIGRYGSEAVWMAAALASYVGDPETPKPVITGAQNGLSGMGLPAALALRSQLTDPNQNVRFAALDVFRLMHPLPPEALYLLTPVLSDSHPTLRQNAIELLQRQGPKGLEILQAAGIGPSGNAELIVPADASFATLMGYLSAADPVARAQACTMLNQSSEYAQAVASLEQAVVNDTDAAVRRCAIMGLITRAPWSETLSETYRHALVDTDPEVRAEACRAFQRAPSLTPAVVDDLFGFFEKDRAVALHSPMSRGSYMAARDALMRHETPAIRARLESIERTAIPIGISEPPVASPAPEHRSSGLVALLILVGLVSVGAFLYLWA